jgi:hypothetical protein
MISAKFFDDKQSVEDTFNKSLKISSK